MEKIDWCKNNHGNSFTTKVDEHIPAGFSISTISSFKIIQNKHYVSRNKESLRENTMEIINFKREKVQLLTNIKMQNLLYLSRKNC